MASAAAHPRFPVPLLRNGAVLTTGLSGGDVSLGAGGVRSAVVTALVVVRRTAERAGALLLAERGTELVFGLGPDAEPASAALGLAVELRRRVAATSRALSLPEGFGLRAGVSSGRLPWRAAGAPVAPAERGCTLATRAGALKDLAPAGRIYLDAATRDAACGPRGFEHRGFQIREVRASPAVFADAPVLAFELFERPAPDAGAPARAEEDPRWMDPAKRSSSRSAPGATR